MRIILFLVVTLCFATSASAQDAAALASVRAAYAAQAKGKWDEALRLAAPSLASKFRMSMLLVFDTGLS